MRSSRSVQVAAAILLAICAFTPPPAAAAPPLQAQRVSDSVWFVQGEAALGTPANRNFISNAGFVVTPAGVVVIDALGAPALAGELIAATRAVTAAPIRHVIVTTTTPTTSTACRPSRPWARRSMPTAAPGST